MIINHEYQFRVRYPDTDQMGTVHHSNYVNYYEMARWELFRSIGITYRSIEEQGILMPVIRMNFRFIKTIHYDELLTVNTVLKAIKGARIWFTYKLFNEEGVLVNEAETELAFVDRVTWKPRSAPDFILNVINEHQIKV
jgi:acyl-CoA thioester hydrolase